MYIVDNSLTFEKKTFSFKELKFLRLHDTNNATVIMDAYDSFKAGNMTKIENKNPNAIETTCAPLKLYQQGSKVIFSFDNHMIKTKLCIIDLENFSYTYKEYLQAAMRDQSYRKSNSYIFDDKLFQIVSSNHKMEFKITDLETDKEIKKYKLTKQDSITFKNSPIIQEGGGILPDFKGDRTREMEKTAKFLRKISAGDLGISAYKARQGYNIILGGRVEVNRGGGMMMMSGAAIPIASVGNITFSFNPMLYGYNNYTSAKTTYINCLFDKSFDHLEGDIPENIYDKINLFEDELKKPKAVNVFLWDQHIYYNYYDSKTKSFSLYRF